MLNGYYDFYPGIMKKLYVENYYKIYNKNRSQNRNKRRLIYKQWKYEKRRYLFGKDRISIKKENQFKKDNPGYIRVIAPEKFSFINNTDEVVKFIGSLKSLYESRSKVYVILENVIEIDHSAIVVLLSIMINFKAKNIAFNGNMPNDSSSYRIVKESGFFDNLYKKFEEKESYKIPNKFLNGIHTHASKKVDSLLSSNIISSAAKSIWGEERRCQGVQRALIELMQNTNNHAEIGKSGEKHWWLSVNQHSSDKKVSFSFVDFGVGIFTNLQNKTSESKFFGWVDKIVSKFNISDNSDVLELILSGELHQTVTGKYYRGKGLPGIAEVLRRNQISNLHIITNDVFCCPSRNIYRTLDKSFAGTFVYWELGENNESCK
jgi:hypothetical protein